MIYLHGTSIAIPRGDCGTVAICFEGLPTDIEAAATVALKRRTTEKMPLWQKELTIADGVAYLDLLPSDTESLPFGLYCWDLRLSIGGYVTTPMAPADFHILEVVGDIDEP